MSIVDDPTLSRPQIRLFILIGALVFMDGFDVQSVGFIAPTLARAWHLTASDLGHLFAAGLLGMLIGSVSLSLVADRIGRRPVMIFGTFFFSVFVLGTAMSRTLPEFIILRFFTGFGIGGVMSNAVTLASEYCPASRRASLLMAISCGFTGGAIAGGLLAAALLPLAGWPAVFVVGGLVPLAIACSLVRVLPESLQFLAASGASRERIEYAVARMFPKAPIGARAVEVAPVSVAGVSVADLFREGRAGLSLLLWVASFANLLNLFFLSNWLPLLATRMGYGESGSALVGTTLQFGGILGALALGPLVDRRGFYRVLAPAFIVGAVMIAIIGRPNLPPAILFAAVLFAGACVVGGQPGINALAAFIYPTRLRATGVGCCLAVGRAGSITGPVLAAYLIAHNFGNASLFLFAAAPAILASAVIHGMSHLATPSR
jgi:AAHS family 4-hydroxybenzoate transporter-like MFS transporter